MTDQKCKWCVNSEGASRSYVFCTVKRRFVGNDDKCESYVRCVGADDDKDESDD